MVSSFQIPLWVANRNFKQFWAEEHAPEGWSYYQIGTGINYELEINEKLRIYGELDGGYGLRFSDAGDFQFKNFENDGFKFLPVLDVGVLYQF